MPQFIIHIGPHKTGSSYLQAALASIATDLRSRGVLFPSDLGFKGHIRLPQQLADPAAHPRLTAQIRTYVDSGAERVVLSSEELGRLHPPEIRALAAMIGDHPVQVVFYCRAWASVCASHWNQQVRQGSSTPLDELLGRYLSIPRQSGIINFARKWTRWTGVFGKPALNLVSLEALAHARIDTLTHFAQHFLGIADLPAVDPALRRNSSMPLAEVEIVRALNQMKQDRTGASDSTIRRRYVAHKTELRLDTALAAIDRSQAILAFDETAPALMRLHRQLFRDYGDRLVEPAPKGQFFTPRAHAIKYIRTDYVSAAGVQAELDAAYGHLSAI